MDGSTLTMNAMPDYISTIPMVDIGNSYNGQFFATKRVKKKRSNRITMRKRLKLKHRKGN